MRLLRGGWFGSFVRILEWVSQDFGISIRRFFFKIIFLSFVFICLCSLCSLPETVKLMVVAMMLMMMIMQNDRSAVSRLSQT